MDLRIKCPFVNNVLYHLFLTKEEERLYLLGIGFRGQTAMTQLGDMDDFMDSSIPVYGRRDWAPGKGHTDGTISYSNNSCT